MSLNIFGEKTRRKAQKPRIRKIKAFKIFGKKDGRNMEDGVGDKESGKNVNWIMQVAKEHGGGKK